MKGVNRHSFRPETARTLSYQNSVEDVLLMKATDNKRIQEDTKSNKAKTQIELLFVCQTASV